MADYINNNKRDIDPTGAEIDAMVAMASTHRKLFERNWYDNNLFDDGYHFRYVNRVTGRIVEQSDPVSSSMPQRAIPKASRQIRGVANLLLSQNTHLLFIPKELENKRLLTWGSLMNKPLKTQQQKPKR